MNGINTLLYAVWHVDKYKITFKLVINHWTNEILYCSFLRPTSGSEFFDTLTNIFHLRIFRL